MHGYPTGRHRSFTAALLLVESHLCLHLPQLRP